MKLIFLIPLFVAGSVFGQGWEGTPSENWDRETTRAVDIEAGDYYPEDHYSDAEIEALGDAEKHEREMILDSETNQ